jgi:hypothetical protein
MNGVVDQVLRDQDAQIGKADHQSVLGLRVTQPQEFEARCFDNFHSGNNDAARPLGTLADDVAELCMLFRRDPIADQFDLRLDFRESMQRSGESSGAKQMVRMIMRDIEARERFAEGADVIDDLARVAQRILRVDGDDLRRQLDEMRIDPPTVDWRRIGVDTDAIALRRSPSMRTP